MSSVPSLDTVVTGISSMGAGLIKSGENAIQSLTYAISKSLDNVRWFNCLYTSCMYLDTTGDLVLGQDAKATTDRPVGADQSSTSQDDGSDRIDWKKRAHDFEVELGEARKEIARLEMVIQDLKKEKMMLQLSHI
jgi:hypothetical protein